MERFYRAVDSGNPEGEYCVCYSADGGLIARCKDEDFQRLVCDALNMAVKLSQDTKEFQQFVYHPRFSGVRG